MTSSLTRAAAAPSRQRFAALLSAACLATGMAAGLGCRREKRDLHPTATEADHTSGISVSELRPGTVPRGVTTALADYQENAYAMNEGKRLFDSYNCTGCHAHGGGAIGPPLIDARWIYGSAPANVFATIVEGRPNGMPSFRGKIPDFQVAQLTAYVRSMAGLAAIVSAPGRSDQMHVKPPENTLDPLPPVGQEAPALQ